MWIYIASRREHISKALRYGTRSQGISQFYLHTPRHYLPLPSQPKLVLVYRTPEEWKAELAWGRWLPK